MSAQLTYWEPEDEVFWRREGARIARRNLAASVPPLMLSFAVWMLWSVVVVYLPHLGFGFTTNQLFWLASAPGLAGGTLRLFFSFMVPIFGGRRWTVISTLALLFPTLGLGLAVQDPTTGYPTFLALALAAGIGGGNFASSMSNVSFFYPSATRGAALGLNAGLGNLGIGLAQLVVPIVVAVGLFGALAGPPQTLASGEPSTLWLQNAGFVWVPLIVVAATIAWYAMDDLPGLRGAAADQTVVFVRRHTWVLSWLYLGTFGSFVGFSAGFPLVLETQYGVHGATWPVILGPLAAAVFRPLGGWLADRHGGAQVVQASFVAMAAGVAALAVSAARAEPATALSYGSFVALFSVLFVASGVGNGAVFQMIPAVFVGERLAARGRASARAAQEFAAMPARARSSSSAHAAAAPAAASPQPRDPTALAAVHEGTLEGAAAIGLASGVAAFGGFFIPKAYGTALSITGGTASALYVFLVFYLTCIATTWWFYLRPRIDRSHFRVQHGG